ncbi:hypothetical protein EVA_19444 [gut metagenome]|uniref:Uncharacterized protein n=1 Tax=gut metagenome TaxID=749906 RepID=J9FYJ8_9ZZZZ
MVSILHIRTNNFRFLLGFLAFITTFPRNTIFGYSAYSPGDGQPYIIDLYYRGHPHSVCPSAKN